MISGRYVKTFAEASHALPDGMHMNADYPFMLPKIEKIEGMMVTITNGRETAQFRINRGPRGEFGYLDQVSTFERFMSFGKATRFRMDPFKDENTPAVGNASIPDQSDGKR